MHATSTRPVDAADRWVRNAVDSERGSPNTGSGLQRTVLLENQCGTVRSKPDPVFGEPRSEYRIQNTEYSLLQVQLVIPVKQHVLEMS